MVALLLCLVQAVTGVILCASPGMAWEFSLTSEAEWRFRYISRTGPGDLFGNAQVAQHTPGTASSIGLAGPQSQAMRVEGFSSKGSDAAYAEQRWFLFPEFKANEAIRLRAHLTFQGNVNANYRGGGANWVTNPHYSGWTMLDSRDLYSGVGLSVPVLRAFWATTKMPWGTLAIGVRPAAFGLGWVVHEDDSYARSVALIVPYGPLTFVVSQYLHDAGYQRTDPNDDRNTRLTGYTIGTGVDQNEVYTLNTAVAVRYGQGSLDMGALVYLTERSGTHTWPQGGGTYQDDISASGIVKAVSYGPALGTTNLPIYITDGKVWIGVTYVKYAADRLSINAEYDIGILDYRRDGGRPISGFSQAWVAEVAGYSGPLKITLANFYKSGHDRRGGLFMLNEATGGYTNLGPPGVVYSNDKFDYFPGIFLGGGDGPIRPYNFLLGLYGTGNNSYSTSGVCTFEDFLAYAARVDYAVAANLNLFASFIKAERASNTGTPQGFYTGSWGAFIADPADQANAPGQGTQFGWPPLVPVTGWGLSSTGPRQYFRIANVPDNDLGWEVNAGFDWKLLEGMTFKVVLGYWQPGKWFKWAYQDMTVSTIPPPPPPPATTTAGYLVGRVNANRKIDPLMGIQWNLLFNF